MQVQHRRYLDDVATGAVSPGDFDGRTYLRKTTVSDGEFEAYLRHTARKLFDTELAAYERLWALKKITTLYGIVDYKYETRTAAPVPDAIGTRSAAGTVRTETKTIPGLPLEHRKYVLSITLRKLVDSEISTARTYPPLPSGVLERVCKVAVKVVDRVSDFDALNKDVRMDNFLDRESFVTSSSGSPHGETGALADAKDTAVPIDLAQC